jgi:hypothetical protein
VGVVRRQWVGRASCTSRLDRSPGRRSSDSPGTTAVLGTAPAYAASHAIGDIEVDARIAKRLDGRKGYTVHLAIELNGPPIV